MILKNTKELLIAPRRIISLVPSITSLLHYLHLEQAVIGITKFCNNPTHWLTEKNILGGTKNIQIEKIKSLNPDLIIANREENVKEQVNELASLFPVWLTDVNNLEDNYKMIEDIGVLTHRSELSEKLILNIKNEFAVHSLENKPKKRAAYIIWNEPYMTVGGDTFISDLLDKAGYIYVFKEEKRYPIVTLDDLNKKGCDCIFLSSEPFPFKEKHIQEIKRYIQNIEIHLVDGVFFSWYGSEILKSPQYFKELFTRCDKS